MKKYQPVASGFARFLVISNTAKQHESPTKPISWKTQWIEKCGLLSYQTACSG